MWQTASRGEPLRQQLQGKRQIEVLDPRSIQMTSQCQQFHLKMLVGLDVIHERSDTAKALLLAATHGRLGARYYVVGGGESKNRQVVDASYNLMDQLLPQGAPHARLITLVSDRPGHDRRYSIDPTLIRSELGWEPSHTFEQCLESTVRWF